MKFLEDVSYNIIKGDSKQISIIFTEDVSLIHRYRYIFWKEDLENHFYFDGENIRITFSNNKNLYFLNPKSDKKVLKFKDVYDFVDNHNMKDDKIKKLFNLNFPNMNVDFIEEL